jgi:hypothetical protein
MLVGKTLLSLALNVFFKEKITEKSKKKTLLTVTSLQSATASGAIICILKFLILSFLLLKLGLFE